MKAFRSFKFSMSRYPSPFFLGLTKIVGINSHFSYLEALITPFSKRLLSSLLMVSVSWELNLIPWEYSSVLGACPQ